MNKILVFGTGKCFDNNKKDVESFGEIVGFVDNFSLEEYKLGKKIYKPSELKTLEYDKIIICSMYMPEIGNQLLKLGIDSHKIELGLDFCGLDSKLIENKKSKIYINNDRRIIFENKNLKMYISTITDGVLIRELFLLDEYNYNFNSKNKYLVIDIGANVGDTALYFSANENVKKVIAFEPFTITYKKAIENINLNESLKNKIDLRLYGLGDENSEIEVEYSESFCGNMSSVTSNIKFGTERCKIDIKDCIEEFQEIVENLKEDKIVIKIDCEGAEFEIFRKLKKYPELLNKVEAILMEWHERDPKEIISILSEMEFNVFCRKTGEKIGMLYAMK